MIRNALLSLSLANLCMIHMWRHLLYRAPSSSSNDYFLKSFPYGVAVCGAYLDVLLLAAAILPCMMLIGQRKSTGALARLAVLVPLFYFVDRILRFGQAYFFGSPLSAAAVGVCFVVALVLVLLLYIVWDRKPKVGDIVSNGLLVLSPFVLITFGHAAWHLVQGDGAFMDRPLAPLIQSPAASPKVLWFIFDEMDQHQAFDKEVKLPEFERFRHESLYATNAYPPASWTIRSLPALFTGKRISKAQPLDARELAITWCKTGKTVKWSHQPNVFSKAREMGFNTAVIGGYHPYCRVINNDVSSCFWEPWDPFDIGPPQTLWRTMVEHFRITFTVFGPSRPLWSNRAREIRTEILRGVLHEVQYHAKVYASILQEARHVMADPRLGLIVVHWNVPHPPSIYDPATQRLRDSQINVTDSSYADNLQLADRTLGAVRRDLEASGAWDSTTLIVSSDHWLRKSLWRYEGETDHRIPFMLKLAGQKQGLTYEKPFNTVLTGDLVLTILSGKITATDEAVTWLDSNRSMAEGLCGYQDDIE